SGAIEAHPPVTPHLAKGQTPAAAVEATRATLKELGDALDSVRSAPVHSEAAKAAIRRDVNALADRGAPDVLRSIELGVPLAWPMCEVPTTQIMGHVVGPGAPQIAGFTQATITINTHALTVWALREVFIAKLE